MGIMHATRYARLKSLADFHVHEHTVSTRYAAKRIAFVWPLLIERPAHFGLLRAIRNLCFHTELT